jgi:hypothetical protein
MKSCRPTAESRATSTTSGEGARIGQFQPLNPRDTGSGYTAHWVVSTELPQATRVASDAHLTLKALLDKLVKDYAFE